MNFNGVKVFSATMKNDRDRLGEDVTEWLRRHPNVEIVDKIVTQSSDSEFHCIAITLFYRDQAVAARRAS
jgi:folate-dependent tRNA-U54 methylase TrmFO/GidA